jgi:membrane-associated phospholipid phosphatase
VKVLFECDNFTVQKQYPMEKKHLLLLLILSFPFFGLRSQQREFPYTISKKDIWIGSTGVTAFITSKYLSNKNDRSLSATEIASLDRNDVNRFDRNATYFWNRSADEVSNGVGEVLPLVPLSLIIPQLKNKKWSQAATLGVIYVEVFLTTRGLTGITKSIVGRTRPYLYNTSFTAQERFDLQENGAPKGSTSFFSGHSSSAFAAAVLLSKTYTDIYGKGTWSTVIWCTSLSLASITAYCRVAAGEHFPSDVIVGAVVGSAIGYVIPTLHKKSAEKISLSVTPNHFTISYKLN